MATIQTKTNFALIWEKILNTKINLFDKKRDTMLLKRFASEDIKRWQEQANLTTGGNLTFLLKCTVSGCTGVK